MKTAICVTSKEFNGTIHMYPNPYGDKTTYDIKDELKKAGAIWDGQTWHFVVKKQATVQETANAMMNAIRPLTKVFTVDFDKRSGSEAIKKLFNK